MKKKNLFMSMLAMAGMLFATSCSQDELLNEPTTGDYVNAKFTISTPEGIGTRAAVNVGEGTTVNYVACAVYDANGTEMDELRQYVPIQSKQAEYSIRLVKGQAYRVAFFAYFGESNGASDYYDMQYLTNIKIKDAASNIEHRDAFTNYVDVTAEESMKAVEKPVTLYRPFAQLNLGAVAKDVEAARKAGVVVTNSKITVSNVYTEFDAYNNTIAAGAQSKEVTFTMNEIPGQDLYVDMDNDATTSDESFEYLALNYLLVGNAGSEKELTDVTFEWQTANNKTNDPVTVFKNIPVQRNYRTNIIGYLLTNPAVFNITIDEKFEKPDYIVEVWDGVSSSTPNIGTDNVCRITSANELIGMMNDSKYPNCNKYQNVVLECDIDLGGHTISGFGDDSGFFDGFFDGQGHYISNFKIDATNRSYYAGLFNQVSQYSGENTVIMNLIVKNATVAGTSQVGVIAGGMNGNTVVENCKVYNSTVSAVKKVGSVVGYTAGGTVKDNYAENCIITYTEKEAGEVLGFENTGSTVSGNTFKDVTFKASAAALAKEMTPDANGVITFTRDYTVTDDWTSQKYSGEITINGNGHTINGLNKPLLAGNAATKLTVNELTIANSEIGVATDENGLGTGAFICFMDATTGVSFNDCHLVKSTVTGNERAAGFIAYSSAKTSVSFSNSSVKDCSIKAVGGAAGLIAYTQTVTEISNSKVTGSTTIEATEDRSVKGTAVAGAIVGTVNANTTLTNVTVDNTTTVKNTGATAHSNMVGRVVSGTLTVN